MEKEHKSNFCALCFELNSKAVRPRVVIVKYPELALLKHVVKITALRIFWYNCIYSTGIYFKDFSKD